MLRILGQLRKATTSQEGVPCLEILVTGPELDRGTARVAPERIGATARAKVVDLAKAGRLPLTPSHDVPLELAKSVDATIDEGGHVVVTYAIDPADPQGMRLHKSVLDGQWAGQVSLGATTCTRATVKDETLGKSITEVTDFDEAGAHVALTFPGKAVYPFAAITAALHKAERDHDTAGLLARGWTPESLEKAVDSQGLFVPPTFAQRKRERDMQDELPEMLDVLRFTVEDIVSPWTGGDKRALLRQTFVEFETAVLGVAEETVAKAEPWTEQSPDALQKAAPPSDASEAAEQQPDTLQKASVVTLTPEEATRLAKAAAEEMIAPLQAALAELRKAAPGPAPAPHIPDTTEAIHTGRTAETAAPPTPTPSLADLRKAIDNERDSARRRVLESRYNDLVMGAARAREV